LGLATLVQVAAALAAVTGRSSINATRTTIRCGRMRAGPKRGLILPLLPHRCSTRCDVLEAELSCRTTASIARYDDDAQSSW
jgi:hypothetical protein